MLQPNELAKAMGGEMNTPYLMVAAERRFKLCGNGVCSDVMRPYSPGSANGRQAAVRKKMIDKNLILPI